MIRLLVCLAVLTVVGVQDLAAQCRTRGNRTECSDRSRTWVVVHERTEDRSAQFGVRGGYDFEAEVGSAGAQFRVPVVSQLLAIPSAVYDGNTPSWDDSVASKRYLPLRSRTSSWAAS